MKEFEGNRKNLTAEVLKSKLKYFPETGLFIGARGKNFVGSIMGNGYVLVSCMGYSHLAHRLAWLYMYGEWPKNQIDHINGVRNDNRIENLRDVKPQINYQNQKKAMKNNTSSGLLGVTWDKSKGKYKASIRTIDGRNKFLGNFENKECAHDSYLKEKRKIHEGCTI